MKTDFNIVKFDRSHWEDVKEIYRLGLLTRNATFETEVPEYDGWIKKFPPQWFWVLEKSSLAVGWAALQPVSIRKVYEGVMEVTIYIHPEQERKGLGTWLMQHLIHESEQAGVWTLYSSIFEENTASIRLHLAAGFRQIGYREKIARLDGQWRNTVLFERRSKKAGV
jgi:L-amino acid N-acyltransferase YncA